VEPQTEGQEKQNSGGLDVTESLELIAAEEQGVPVPLLDFKGDPAMKPDKTPVTWTIAFAYSSRYREALGKSRKRETARRGQVLSIDEAVRDDAEFIADISVGWDGLTDKGQPLAFTRETAIATLVKLPFVRMQLGAKAHDHKAAYDFFNRASSTASSTS